MKRIPMLAAVLAVWVSSAAADTAPSFVHAIYSHGGAPPQVTLTGTPEVDRVRVTFTGGEHEPSGEYEIVAPPVLEVGENCVSVDAATARCKRLEWPFPGGDHFVALLGRGDDTFRMQIPWRSASIEGEEGDDTIIGSAAASDFFGGGGQDILRGRGGADRLYGFKGHDRLHGGSGDDRLDTADGDRDRLIDCGPGDDKAFIDAIDPEPRHCEKVRVVPARDQRDDQSERVPLNQGE